MKAGSKHTTESKENISKSCREYFATHPQVVEKLKQLNRRPRGQLKHPKEYYKKIKKLREEKGWCFKWEKPLTRKPGTPMEKRIREIAFRRKQRKYQELHKKLGDHPNA